jgi:acetoin utilization protein AcuB
MTPPLVRDWMTYDPITVDPKTTLPVAYHLMKLNNVRRLPVVDEAGHLIGIVTQGDIREARPKHSSSSTLWEYHFATASMEVQDFMTIHPLTVTPETEIREAAELMLRHKVGGLPVVLGARLVGMLTDTDLCRLLVDLLPSKETATEGANEWDIEPPDEVFGAADAEELYLYTE